MSRLYTAIYHEMMSHVPIFSHLHPQKIAVIGDETGGIIEEILKHKTLATIFHATKKNKDKRTRVLQKKLPANSLDILIVDTPASHTAFPDFFSALQEEGIIVLQAESPFEVDRLKSMQSNLVKAGFSDVQTLHFPEPHFSVGWRAAMMAKKGSLFHRIREKDIFNRTFSTQYYNFDSHKAALTLPEFMRVELIPEESV